MIDLHGFQKSISLPGGRPAVIRMARADDRQRIVTAFERLDRQTVYSRFFSFKSALSPDELARLDAPASNRYILLVVTVGSGADETIIAGASCAMPDAGTGVRSAELAFTVEEDYQRQGLASQLLATILELARSRGIGRCEADVLAENHAMLEVFRRGGWLMSSSRSGSVIHVVLDAPPVA